MTLQPTANRQDVLDVANPPMQGSLCFQVPHPFQSSTSGNGSITSGEDGSLLEITGASNDDAQIQLIESGKDRIGHFFKCTFRIDSVVPVGGVSEEAGVGVNRYTRDPQLTIGLDFTNGVIRDANTDIVHTFSIDLEGVFTYAHVYSQKDQTFKAHMNGGWASQLGDEVLDLEVESNCEKTPNSYNARGWVHNENGVTPDDPQLKLQAMEFGYLSRI